MTFSTCSPKPANRYAIILVLGLSAAAAVAFAASFFLPAYSGVVQLLCFLALVYALFIASRFLFVSYTYSLLCSEKGIIYFLIEEKQGKRSSLVCQLPLSRIHAIKPMAQAREEARARHYTYIATMLAGTYQMLIVEGEKGRTAIKIEADEAFLNCLREAQAGKTLSFEPGTDEE